MYQTITLYTSLIKIELTQHHVNLGVDLIHVYIAV